MPQAARLGLDGNGAGRRAHFSPSIPCPEAPATPLPQPKASSQETVALSSSHLGNEWGLGTGPLLLELRHGIHSTLMKWQTSPERKTADIYFLRHREMGCTHTKMRFSSEEGKQQRCLGKGTPNHPTTRGLGRPSSFWVITKGGQQRGEGGRVGGPSAGLVKQAPPQTGHRDSGHRGTNKARGQGE